MGRFPHKETPKQEIDEQGQEQKCSTQLLTKCNMLDSLSLPDTLQQ